MTPAAWAFLAALTAVCALSVWVEAQPPKGTSP